MAQREMSGKALLDKLYCGLDTMPAVEAEMDAGDLRRLTDDLLGKPTEPDCVRPAHGNGVPSCLQSAVRLAREDVTVTACGPFFGRTRRHDRRRGSAQIRSAGCFASAAPCCRSCLGTSASGATRGVAAA